ncbi:MAG: hypothetical protein ACTSWL_06685 [Promethearchaeota archaeon]
MFDALDGGVIEPIEFSKDNLTAERSIIIIDESSQIVWLWHGKRRALVPRRTALRQAQSLKGHGYQAGLAIIGRDLHSIIEIDDRKVGRDPETTENNKRLMVLLDNSFTHIGNLMYTIGGTGAKNKEIKTEPTLGEKPVPSPVTREKKIEKQQLTNEEPIKKEKPVKLEGPKIPKSMASEASGSVNPLAPINPPAPISPPTHVNIPTPVKPQKTLPKVSPLPEKNEQRDDVRKALVITAVLEQFKDIWISRKDDGSISIEEMDGKICSFLEKDGKIQLQPNSFANIDSAKKMAIEERIKDLL